MADNLEEPGGPWLGQPANPGATFLNAFALMSQVNSRKQALEQQLAEMQSNNLTRQQAHDLEMQKFGWQQKFQTAELNRMADNQQSEATYRDLMSANAVKRLNWEMGKGVAADTAAADYQSELQDVAQQHAEDLWSTSAANDISLVNQKYAGVTGTLEGKRAWTTFNQQLKAAQLGAHKSAADLKTNLLNTLQGGSRTPGLPWNLADLGLDSDYHIPAGKDQQGNDTTTIAEVPGINPVTGKPGYQPVTKAQLSTPGASYPGIRYRTINTAAMNKAMPLYQQFSSIASGDPNFTPAPVELSRTDLARQALTDPDATAQEKAAAQRILNGQ